MLTYELFGYAKRTAIEDGAWFPTSGRTRWTVALEIARLSGGANVTVTLEASPTGEAGSESQILTFGSLAATGETEKSSLLASPDFTVTPRDLYLRGRVTAIVGDVTCRLRAWAPFLDLIPEDLSLLSAELRESSALERVLRRAEDDVLALIVKPVRLLRRDSSTWAVDGWPGDHDANVYTPLIVAWGTAADAEALAGTPRGFAVDADMRLPGFAEAMRAEVARQAEHRFRRFQLEQRASDPSVLVTLRNMDDTAPGLGEAIAPYRLATSTAWRGR